MPTSPLPQHDSDLSLKQWGLVHGNDDNAECHGYMSVYQTHGQIYHHSHPKIKGLWAWPHLIRYVDNSLKETAEKRFYFFHYRSLPVTCFCLPCENWRNSSGASPFSGILISLLLLCQCWRLYLEESSPNMLLCIKSHIVHVCQAKRKKQLYTWLIGEGKKLQHKPVPRTAQGVLRFLRKMAGSFARSCSVWASGSIQSPNFMLFMFRV